jgi:hypothetical protein
MKYLEDTLAEQCLSKNFISEYKKIHVVSKKVEGTLMTYTNDIAEVDFSDVDPSL